MHLVWEAISNSNARAHTSHTIISTADDSHGTLMAAMTCECSIPLLPPPGLPRYTGAVPKRFVVNQWAKDGLHT